MKVKGEDIIILVWLLFGFVAASFAQGCSDPYYIGTIGNWSDCWEAPQTFSVDCFNAYSNPDCDQCGGVYLEFETTGTVSILIESDLNYDWLGEDSNELFVHFYILDGCGNPIYYTGSCGGETIGSEYFVDTSAEGWPVASDYVTTLDLPPGTYYLVTGNIGAVGVQDDIEGCMSVTIVNESPLSLNIEELKSVKNKKGIKGYNILGQKLGR